jgi:hypothetical protein
MLWQLYVYVQLLLELTLHIWSIFTHLIWGPFPKFDYGYGDVGIMDVGMVLASMISTLTWPSYHVTKCDRFMGGISCCYFTSIEHGIF